MRVIYVNYLVIDIYIVTVSYVLFKKRAGVFY